MLPGAAAVSRGTTADQVDGCSPAESTGVQPHPSSVKRFSPTFSLAHAHPKAALGMLIFMLILPSKSCLLFLKNFLNLNFNNAFPRTLQWLPSLPMIYKPVSPFPCALAAADRDFPVCIESHSSDLSSPVRLFINYYFGSSNDHRAVCALHSQPRALQSAPPCVLLNGALPHFQLLQPWLRVHWGGTLRTQSRCKITLEIACKYALLKQDTRWIFLQVIITVVTFLAK